MLAATPSATKLSITAPAKINLFLKINGKRADGYHNLQTLFQILDIGDQIELKRTSDGSVNLSNQLTGVEQEDNLAFRAAKLLQQATGCARGADISIAKQLPMGGGLGGGSSNAASVLLGLNALWDTGLSLAELAELGLQLGADVPVFIWGQSSLAEGVGERLYPVELVENYYLVLRPAVEVSTAKIFADPALTRNSPAIRIAAFFQQATPYESEQKAPASISNELRRSKLEEWQKLGNDCESVVRANYPEVDEALNWLSQYTDARLTGTGSCIFGAFESRAEAEKALSESPLNGFVAKACNLSPAHKQLRQLATF